MTWFYVKSGFGTCLNTDGAHVSQLTGAFSAMTASETYATISNVFIYNTVAAGDYILVSDSHNQSSLVDTALSGPTENTTDSAYLLCVSDTDCTTESTGGKEGHDSGGGDDWRLYGDMYVYGLTFEAGDKAFLENGGCQQTYAYCDWIVDTDNFNISAEDCWHNFFHTDFDFSAAVITGFSLTDMCNMHVYGGTVDADHSVMFGGHGNGGGYAYFEGTTFTIDSGTLYLTDGIVSATDDGYHHRFNRCKLPSSWAASDGTPYRDKHEITVSNCSNTSAGAAAQYLYQSKDLKVEATTTIYRNNSTSIMPSDTQVGLLFTTGTVTDELRPSMYQFPTRWIDFSAGASDTVRIHIASNGALTDADIVVRMGYMDGTNKNAMNWVDAPTAFLEPLRSGTTLTTSSETWTGASGYANKYQIELSTTGDAGIECIPVIFIWIFKSSLDAVFCPTLEVL